MKKVSTAFLFLLLAVPVWGQQNVKIGFVNLQKAIRDSQAGKNARNKFQVVVKKIEEGLLKEKQNLDRLRSDIEKKGLLLKSDERRNMEKEFQRRARDFNRVMKDSREELRQKEGEMTTIIFNDLEKVVAKIGKEGKFTVILERGQVLYTDKGIDITDRVIESYDRSGDKKGSKSK